MNGYLISSNQIVVRCDDFIFPIVNFKFLISNIPVAPVYGVYISQLIHIARACPQYSEFLNRAQLLPQELPYRHNELGNRSEISISLVAMGCFLPI